MKKLILGLVAGAAMAAVVASGPAFADNSNNGTTNDSHGYATANPIHNFVQPAGGHGIGTYRSTETGQEIAALGGHRGGAAHPDWITTQGQFDPISNSNR